MNLIKPEKLNIGDTIAIIALCGAVKEQENILRAKKYFEQLGYNVKLASNIFDKNRYLAGDDEKKINELHGFFKVGFGFTGEAHDEVGGQGNVRAGGTQLAYQRFVFECGVATLHQRQNPVGTGLYWQVQMRNQLGNGGVAIHDALVHFAGM